MKENHGMFPRMISTFDNPGDDWNVQFAKLSRSLDIVHPEPCIMVNGGTECELAHLVADG